MPSVDIADGDGRNMVEMVYKSYIHVIGAANCSQKFSQYDHRFQRFIPWTRPLFGTKHKDQSCVLSTDSTA